MNEFLTEVKQRLKEKQDQEEELKMKQLTTIIEKDNNMSKKLSKLSNINKSLITENENESKIKSTSSSELTPTNISDNPNLVTSIKNKKTIMNSSNSTSIRKFKSTKPKITKADKKFCEG
ncbi:hypothetical protein BCR32DRAFT_245072 [Anaeromyces robustus]|uniref:Uncharacterized protein n=1 Tax=Anaeromyces robustus TaxID=1754192 RepID=A0A1Y1X5W2_9FUNG|nr:hypothetical protein BCR32DRAFT_245072 [Anaeromyces robustus]|eukprot:ORX81200.1 hypothetical protein BCR32DRAFT_245072 [Anaeromyces robustus]